jgi:CubicO group peptidase (beta-lactamase class C family)
VAPHLRAGNCASVSTELRALGLAEIIERVTGQDYRDVVESRVTTPAGLERVLGGVSPRAAELVLTGSPATSDEMMATFGVPQLDVGEVTNDALLAFNDCTNGLDANEIREPRRTTAIASLAAVCATS